MRDEQMKDVVMVRGLRLSMFALASVFLVSCSLLDSSNEGATAQPPSTIDPANVAVVSTGDYKESCREKGVPVPPDWSSSSSEWKSHGNLHTILLTPNSLEQTPVDDRLIRDCLVLCITRCARELASRLGRSSGTFQIICQSATTGHACFWSNDPSCAKYELES